MSVNGTPAARVELGVKIYGEGVTEVRALDEISVAFDRGAYTAIMGPSGSGKSTLLHCAAGLDTLTGGSAYIGDVRLGDLGEKTDFALAFAVVHEAADAKTLLSELRAALRPGAKLLISEPKGHVSPEEFEVTVDLAREAGLTLVERPVIRSGRSALLRRLGAQPGAAAA